MTVIKLSVKLGRICWTILMVNYFKRKKENENKEKDE